ncbi:SDR family NAD(P)-dependent oxidoreductase [Cobetia sp. MMG027]|uniref:SDR family NAD(P)-dependent oxidoreductase n=1 Tax=Cobetia sp. MMG027 TaxID=3021980 RepID=UPI0022FED619|nr:SDR family NAD(P)-dependent oxidoreductase [Cobetia sp. MMG027]MDA5564618.1 SDR family NAD(P)-dependent oxidoreductase [Cobetia sp. MMG027]
MTAIDTSPSPETRAITQSPGQRVALVTGAAGGIGREIVRGLMARDYLVYLSSRAAESAQQAVDTLMDEAPRGEVRPCVLEMTCTEHLRDVIAMIKARDGRLDVLVNNAGIYLEAPHLEPARPTLALEQPVEMVRESLETNLLGAYQLTQLAVPLMQRHGEGRIVNVSSGSGQLAEMGAGDIGYRLSKAGLNAMTRVFAAELQGSGILVNAMCPGWVNTGVGGPDAPRTPQQGADTALWLATLPDDGPSGGFFRDRQPIAW